MEEHLEGIASLKGNSLMREGILSLYSDPGLVNIPSLISKEYLSNREIIGIVPILFKAQFVSYYKDTSVSEADLREDFDYFKKDLKEEIEKSRRKNKEKLTVSLMERIDKVEEEVVDILTKQQNVKTH